MNQLVSKRTVALLFATAILGLGSSCPRTPTTTTTTITIGSTLDLGTTPTRLARTYALFLGGTTNAYTLNLSISGLSGGTTLTVSSATGASTQAFTANATSVITQNINGNVALLTLTSGGIVRPPTVTVNSATVTAVTRVPQLTPALADVVSALPIVPGSAIRPNTSVELPFDGTKRFYFISATGLAGAPVDVVLDGPGKVLMRETTNDFLITDDESAADDVVNAASGNMKSFTPTAAQNTLLFTVIVQADSSSGPSGLARFSVNQPTDLIPLTVRFADSLVNYPDSGVPKPPGAPVTPFPPRASMATTITPLINRASQALYQATEGRVRISNVTVFTSLEASLTTRANAQIYPRNFPGGLLRAHTNPIENIALDLDWLNNGTSVSGDAGWVLAHEIMHWRYRLLDEYRDAMPLGLDPSGPVLCPVSMMSVFGAVELCWPGNHNPTGDAMLSLPPRNNVSAWGGLVPRLRPSVPGTSPTRILITGSNRVSFPLSTSTVN